MRASRSLKTTLLYIQAADRIRSHPSPGCFKTSQSEQIKTERPYSLMPALSRWDNPHRTLTSESCTVGEAADVHRKTSRKSRDELCMMCVQKRTRCSSVSINTSTASHVWFVTGEPWASTTVQCWCAAVDSDRQRQILRSGQKLKSVFKWRIYGSNIYTKYRKHLGTVLSFQGVV